MEKRVYYFDWLRIFATVAVVVIHIAGAELFACGINTFEWSIYNILDSFSRFSVPVFLMISGALFLDPENNIETKRIYSKNLLRIITAFLFWSVIYALTEYSGDKLAFFRSVLLGHYHMYFLFIIASLYVAVPILRKICENKKTAVYFLILAVLSVFILPSVAKLPHMSFLYDIDEKMRFRLVGGYSAYFIGGYYLNRTELSKPGRRIIYVLGIAAFIATAALTKYFSMKTNSVFDGFYSWFSITTMLEAVCVFVFAKHHFSSSLKTERGERLLSALSKLTFGVYLVHVLVIKLIDTSGVFASIDNALIYFVLKTALTLVTSFLVSYALNKLPFFKKYIV
ncbi:MAG: acyltransferase family protein [Oscillospiraceae bacterium]|nr:acyltransferase family protein [Oscillospiraceae bacterium]